jgi:hypothetical protein
MKHPPIYQKKPVFLQCILDAVTQGYSYYTSGCTSLEKLEQAVAVFDLNYRAFGDRNERARRIRRGLANVRVHMFYRAAENKVYWCMLAMPPQAGKHPVHATDKLHDAFDAANRIVFDGLELVRLPKKGTPKYKLSWRLTSEQYLAIQNEIKNAVRSRSHRQMILVLNKLWTLPGFSGVRSQIGHLVALYKQEIKRSSLKGAPEPPTSLLYIRRIPHTGLTVKQLLARIKASESKEPEVISS